nr:uncharacterized protein LOC111413780 [Onthophagus taurus]
MSKKRSVRSIFAVNIQPYVINVDDNKNPGYEIVLLKELGKELKYQIDFVPHKELNWGGILFNGSFTMLYKRLFEKEVDLIIGMVMANETYYKDFSPTIPYSNAFLTFYTPSAQKIAGWETFILIFDRTTWILLIISGLFITATWWLITKYENNSNDETLIDSAFKIWCIIFSAFNTQPKLILLRLLFVLWAMYCFIINCTYQSLLISFLTKPTFDTQITNVDELLKSDLELGGFWSLRNVFYNTGNSQSDLVYKKWITCPLNEECVNRTAYYTESSGRLRLYQFKTLTIYFIWMVFNKNFPLLDRFNEYLLRMTDSGLILKWDKDSQRYERNSLITDEYQPFSLDDLKLCFVVLCVGYVFAIIVFIFERKY